MKKLSLFILSLVSIVEMSAQLSQPVYKIPFKEVVDSACYGNLVNLHVAKDYSFLKNIPDVKCDLSAINYFKINQFVRNDSIPNQIYLFTGVNEMKKEKYVVVDTNNNHDFSDNKLCVFSIPDKPLTRVEYKNACVGLELVLDVKTKYTVHIGIDPFNYHQYQYGLPQDKRLDYVIAFVDYMIAKSDLEGSPIEIDAGKSWNLLDQKLNDRSDFNIRYLDIAGNTSSRTFMKGDTIQVRDKMLLLTKIEHPFIYLEQIGIETDSSWVGSAFPQVRARDLETDKEKSIHAMTQGKYVFIDFWGSWCGPCISSIPKLKSLYEKIKDRQDVLLLGLAQEADKKGLERLKSLIGEQKIGWTNLWFSRDDCRPVNSILKKLNIPSFPTYLIINKEGQIVYKQNSSFKTEEAIDFFLKMINKAAI